MDEVQGTYLPFSTTEKKAPDPLPRDRGPFAFSVLLARHNVAIVQRLRYTGEVSWSAERTAEFDEWWKTLSDAEQRKIVASVEALQELGPTAGRPLVDSVKGSKHSNMKELRVTKTMRIFFAFDPSRVAILLIGGDKAGKIRRFYKQIIPLADSIYDKHLEAPPHHDGDEEEDERAQAVPRAEQGGS